jgi:hypothetical protein
MAGLSISPNHRPRILPGCPTRGHRPGHRDRWRRLASEPSGCICVAAVVLIALIIFMIPALEAASSSDRVRHRGRGTLGAGGRRFQFGTRAFVVPYGTFSDQRGTLPAQRQYSPHSTPDREWRPKIR